MFKPIQQKVIAAIEKVMAALGDLKDDVAVVGGAVVGLYVDDPVAADVRPTRDVDLMFEIATRTELQELEKKLVDKGFKHAQDENVICRFIIDEILVDVMATKEVGWAPAGPWFAEGFQHLIGYELKNSTINILPFVYFLATKFSAFQDRAGDPRQSKDFEDIVYLLDNRTIWVEDVSSAEPTVKDFIIGELQKISADENVQEAIQAHLDPTTQSERFKMLMDKISEVVWMNNGTKQKKV